MKSYLNSNIKNRCFLVFLFIVFGGFLFHSKPIFADVNPDGSFSYSIPIKTPPGTNGVAPQLSLDYNSNAGNGMLGMGFSLSGLSEMTRMSWGKGINYNGQDTYLGPDGRLVDINGNKSEYHTEHESWAKHVPEGTCGDGPCSWTVYEKTGNKFYFGTSEDSRIEAVGKKGGVRVWALHKFEDRFGNYYEVEYFEDAEGGDYYPKRITYTKGNGLSTFHTVEFGYGEKAGVNEPSIIRHDHWEKYNWGVKVDTVRILNWLELYAGNELIKKYRLIYDTQSIFSRLIKIDEFGNSSNKVLNLIQIRWASQTTNGVMFSPKSQILGDGFTPSKDRFFTGDFNGDGLTDILLAKSAGMSHGLELRTKLSNGNGTFTPKSQILGDGVTLSKDRYFTGDFNGDGLTDILLAITSNSHGLELRTKLSNGDGTFTPKRQRLGDGVTLG
jgi:hypothetical protein